MLRAALAAALVLVSSAHASAVLIDGPDGSLDIAPFPATQQVLPNVGTRGPTAGYVWLPTSHVRSGTNHLEVYPAGGKIFNARALGSFFDSGRPLPESQAVTGDYADLADYRPQPEDAVALPEADRMLAPGAALLAWLALRRRRAAAAAAAGASPAR